MPTSLDESKRRLREISTAGLVTPGMSELAGDIRNVLEALRRSEAVIRETPSMTAMQEIRDLRDRLRRAREAWAKVDRDFNHAKELDRALED